MCDILLRRMEVTMYCTSTLHSLFVLTLLLPAVHRIRSYGFLPSRGGTQPNSNAAVHDCRNFACILAPAALAECAEAAQARASGLQPGAARQAEPETAAAQAGKGAYAETRWRPLLGLCMALFDSPLRSQRHAGPGRVLFGTVTGSESTWGAPDAPFGKFVLHTCERIRSCGLRARAPLRAWHCAHSAQCAAS